MMATQIGKPIFILLLLVGVAVSSRAQITSASIKFERRTNVWKTYKDVEQMARMRDMLEKNKIKKDYFTLYFNDSLSVFVPEEKTDEGMMSWLTQSNYSIQRFEKDQRVQILELWGSQIYLQDTLKKRPWVITYDKRKIAGYECRKAIWRMNDTTNIYAWYSDQIEVSTGPESFNGLPGTILGLATEDGRVVYFAKEVEIKQVDPNEFLPKYKEKDCKTEAQLRADIIGRMSKMMPDPKAAEAIADGLLSW